MKTDISRTKSSILAAFLALAVLPAAAQEGPAGILQAIAVDRNDLSVVYTSGAGILWRSTDYGKTWSASQSGINAWSIAVDNADIVADPDAIQVIYAATQNNGVMKSEYGATWSAGNGLSGSVRSVAVHPYANVVYAGAEDAIYVSYDSGMNWDILSNALGTGITQGLVVDPANPLVMYAAKWGQGVYRSIDGGISWQLSASGMFDTQLFDLDLHPMNSSILFAATPSGVFRSVDAGVNWVVLDSPRRASEIAIDPQNPDRLIVTTEGNGIARSTDTGEAWTAINEGLGGVMQFVSVAIVPDGSGVVYAGSVNSGIFISNDFGDTWSQTYTLQPIDETPPGTTTPPPVSTPLAAPTTLSIRINGRNGEKVELGERAKFDIKVKNTGSNESQNTQLRIAWEQIDHGGRSWTGTWSGGSCGNIECNIGSIAANSEIVVTFSGSTSSDFVGPFNLTATVESDNANAVTASKQVTVVRSIFSISSEGGGGTSSPLLLLSLSLLMLWRSRVEDCESLHHESLN